MLIWEEDNIGNSFQIREGQLYLGRGSDKVPGFKGWLDDFKVVGNAMDMMPEEICNQSLGTLIGVRQSARDDIKVLPQDSRQRLKTIFVLKSHLTRIFSLMFVIAVTGLKMDGLTLISFRIIPFL